MANQLQAALTAALKHLGHKGHGHGPEATAHMSAEKLAEALVDFPDVAALRTEGISIKQAAAALHTAKVAGTVTDADWAALGKALGE